MTATDNSWVLITGASSGFGEESARQYAQQGHSLVLVARRLDRLQMLAESLRRQYRINVAAEQVDLSDVAAVIPTASAPPGARHCDRYPDQQRRSWTARPVRGYPAWTRRWRWCSWTSRA